MASSPNMRVRKADEPAFNDAVESALLAIRPQLIALREVLPSAIFGSGCPDSLLDNVRKEVMNRVVQVLGEPVFPPLTADGL
jgi:hypothetical protein